MIEEPRIHEALQRLMEMLDKEVLRELIRTSSRQLDTPGVEQAQESLRLPERSTLTEGKAEAREKVEESLLEYLESMDDWMHLPETPPPY